MLHGKKKLFLISIFLLSGLAEDKRVRGLADSAALLARGVGWDGKGVKFDHLLYYPACYFMLQIFDHKMRPTSCTAANGVANFPIIIICVLPWCRDYCRDFYLSAFPSYFYKWLNTCKK